MRKTWNKPTCNTLMMKRITAHIKAAAWSEEGLCTDFVLR